MDLRSGKFWCGAVGALALVAGAIWFLSSDDGVEALQSSVEAIDDVSDGLTGNQAVQQSQGVRAQLEDIRSLREQQLQLPSHE